MKRIILCLVFALSACGIQQEDKALLDAPIMESPVMEMPIVRCDVSAEDGIGGTGCS